MKILIILLLLIKNVYAGVDLRFFDQAMSVPKIPDFYNGQEAIRYANNIIYTMNLKYIEIMRRTLRDHIVDERKRAHLGGTPTLKDIKNAGYYMHQVRLSEIALKTLQNFLSHVDQAQLGSTIFIGETPCHLIK